MESPHIRFELKKLKDPKIAEAFQTKVDGKYAALCVHDNDVDTVAKIVKEIIFSKVEEVLGRERKKI